MSAERILVVEDERDIATALRVNLSGEGYAVTVAVDGDQALEALSRESFDLVLLDVMLPGVDGIEVCRRVRERDAETPVLFLSALGETHHRIVGLRAGGDDYLPKPFDLDELLLRVQALLRRRAIPAPEEESLRIGTHVVHWRRGVIEGPDGEQPLGDKELRLLRYLSARRGEIVLRADILDVVWGPDQDPTARTIDNFIVRLRRMLGDDPASPRFLFTHRGSGYRLEVGPGTESAP